MTTPQANITHDITLQEKGMITARGFMLAKDEKGKMMYSRGFAAEIAPQQTQGQPSPVDVPLEKEIAFIMDSWHAGMSEKVYSGNPYIKELVCGDTRYKNKMMLPPLVTAGPTTGVATTSNLGFESWTNLHPDSWTLDNYIDIARNATSPIAGTYDATLKVRACQLKEHKTGGDTCGITFSKPDSTTVRIADSGIASVALNGYFFINFNRLWLNSKTIKIDWAGSKDAGSAAYSASMTIVDGSYDRTSGTDFPNGSPRIDKGGGLLQTLTTAKTATFVAEQVSATVSVGSGTQTDCCLMIRLAVTNAGTDYVQVDRVQVLDGTTSLYDNHITDALTNEQTGTNVDYSRIGATSGQIYQLVTGILKGLTVTVSVRAKTSTASLVRAFIDDGSTVTYSSYHTGGGAEETLPAGPIAISNTATKTWIGIAIASEGNTASVDTFATTVVINHAGIIKGMFERSTTLYCCTTKAIMKWDNTNTAWIVLAGFGASTATRVSVYNSNIFVALGNATDYIYSDDGGTTWTTSTLGTKQFDIFIVYGTTLWGIIKPNTLRTNTSGINGGAAWTAAVSIRDSSFDVNDIEGLGANMYVGKADSMAKIDSTPTVTEIKELKPGAIDAQNFVGMIVAQGHLFLPTKTGLKVFDGTDITDISPPKYMPDVSATRFQGQFKILTEDTEGGFVFVMTATGGLFTVRRESIAGTTPETDWRWQTLYDISSMQDDSSNVVSIVDCSWVSRLQTSSGRLWFWGSSNSAYKAFYIILPGSTSPDQNTSCTFKRGLNTEIYLPAWDYSFPSVNKAFLSCEIQGTGLSGTGATQMYAQVKYKIDGGSETNLGNFTSSGSVVYFANTATGKEIQLILYLYRGASVASTSTPVITKIILKASFRPTVVYQWDIGVDIRDGLPLLTGAKSNETAEEIAADLTTCVEATWPLTFVDITGTSYSAEIVRATFRDEPVQRVKLGNTINWTRRAFFRLIQKRTS